ncbi:flagellar hook-length control protein FliK [Paenibacillus gorillae]|uniref:flagellar hook-length control protein FliK n=1 Tax=Paenibacillus gorillae TaxID=1243662 RepID=UPI0004B9CF0F|nr:flagellar hook-length control protein FliK [Paenibacillus gorillae]
MDMIMASIPANGGAAASTSGAGQTKAGGAAGFQQALVYQMNGGSSKASSGSASVDPAAVFLGASLGGGGALTIGAEETRDLLSMLDALIGELDTGEEQEADAGSDEAAKELGSVLDQFNALLALLGIPALTLAQVQDGGQADSDTGQNPASAVKLQLQDSLLQLQAAVQDGSLKQIQQQEPTQLIGQQLQALQELLQKQKGNIAAKDQAAVKADGEQLAAPVVTQSTATSAALLQRLTQQSVHPSVMLAAVEETASDSMNDSFPAGTEEQGAVVPSGAVFGDVLRTAAQHPAARALLQPYVAADQFAETMSQFVQKLDISILNGGKTEAKIQLFPEQLGQVDVRITMQNGQLTAVFHTDTVSAKDVLDNQMAQLRAALQAQGLSVDKLEVTQGQHAAQLAGGQHGQGTAQQNFAGQNKSKGDRISDDAGFESEVAEQIAIQDLGFGRAVNVTA